MDVSKWPRAALPYKDLYPPPANEIETLRSRISELESALAKSASREAALVEVVECARGLSFGEDWNNGAHAKIYRPKLLAALAKIKSQA